MVFSDANLHFCLLTLRLITTWSKMKEKDLKQSGRKLKSSKKYSDIGLCKGKKSSIDFLCLI